MRPPRNPLSGSHCKIQIPKKGARACVYVCVCVWGDQNPQTRFSINRLGHGKQDKHGKQGKVSKQATAWQIGGMVGNQINSRP